MTANIKLDDRLSILRTGDRFTNWNSLDDHRLCGVCGRKFKGRQIEIRRFPGGRYKLCCPTLGCPSEPQQWCYPRPPVVSEIAEQEWSPADKQPVEQMASTSQTGGHSL